MVIISIAQYQVQKHLLSDWLRRSWFENGCLHQSPKGNLELNLCPCLAWTLSFNASSEVPWCWRHLLFCNSELVKELDDSDALSKEAAVLHQMKRVSFQKKKKELEPHWWRVCRLCTRASSKDRMRNSSSHVKFECNRNRAPFSSSSLSHQSGNPSLVSIIFHLPSLPPPGICKRSLAYP